MNKPDQTLGLSQQGEEKLLLPTLTETQPVTCPTTFREGLLSLPGDTNPFGFLFHVVYTVQAISRWDNVAHHLRRAKEPLGNSYLDKSQFLPFTHHRVRLLKSPRKSLGCVTVICASGI